MKSKYIDYNNKLSTDETYIIYEDIEARKENSTVECGNKELLVNFIPAPFTGCYLKVTCPKCGLSDELFDDYS